MIAYKSILQPWIFFLLIRFSIGCKKVGNLGAYLGLNLTQPKPKPTATLVIDIWYPWKYTGQTLRGFKMKINAFSVMEYLLYQIL